MSDHTALAAALDALARAVAAGSMPTLVRGEMRLDGIDPSVAGPLAAAGPLVQSLLAGQRKDWAAGRREVVLAAVGRGGHVHAAAAVELLERRVFGRACALPPSNRAGWRDFVGDPHAVVVPEGSFSAQAAVGALLAEAEIGRGRLEIVEVPLALPDGEDFRIFLAGSSWLAVPVPDEEDVAARALRAALAVRSIRKDVPKTFKQGLFTARAVKAAGRAKEPPAAIAARLHLPEELVRRWLAGVGEEGAGMPAPSGADAPSEAQRRYVRALVADLPPLRHALPEDWAFRRDVVKDFLDRAAKPAEGWRPRWRAIAQGWALRRALAEGEPLADAARAAGLSRADALAALEVGLAHEEEALRAEMSAALGTELPRG
jgi:hypothetical protein